jgi:hypothetical protein
LITEILGVVLGPVILGLWLPSIASLIAERLQSGVVHSSNLGDLPSAAALSSVGGELASIGEGRRASLLREPRAARAAVLAAKCFGSEASPEGQAFIDEFGDEQVFSSLERKRPTPGSLLNHPYLVA